MCGIFAYFSKSKIEDDLMKECYQRTNTLKPRGPEKYKFTALLKKFLWDFKD